MVTDRLDAAYATHLLERQDALQAEARQVVAELDLVALLGRAGRPEQIGSAVSGLMVWRDLDLSVVCGTLTREGAFETMYPLLTGARVLRAEYRNETGRHAPAELRGDERHYFVLHYLTAGGHEWKIDVSLWLGDAPRDDLAFLERLRVRLTH